MKLKSLVSFIRSLRFKGFVAIALAAVIPTFIFISLFMVTYDRSAYRQRVSVIKTYGSTIALDFISLGGVNKDTLEGLTDDISNFANVYSGRVVVVDDRLRVIYDTYGLEAGKTLISAEAVKGLKGSETIYRNNIRNYVEITLPVKDSSSGKIYGAMVFSFSLKDISTIADELLSSVSFIISIVLLFVILYAVFFAERISRPLVRLSNAIDHVSDGYSDEPLEVKGYTELRGIAISFNKMLARIRKMEGSRQEFVSNVSHELKTPMTSMKVLADSLIGNPDASLEMYKDFMTDIDNEIERENKIINDLLSLVKLDRKTASLNITSVDMNEMVQGILKRVKPLADKNGIELYFESFRGVTAEVDEVKLSLALMNLVENAIKYNVPDGWVRVSLNADHKFFFVKVSDSGIGIPDESKDRIFERFYRVDKARSRGTGGTGLGLSITKNVIIAHHGEIKVFSKENEGTTFTVRIPLSYIQPEKNDTVKKGGSFKLARNEKL